MPLELPPRVPGHALLNAARFVRDPLGFLAWAHRHGDLVRVPLGVRETYLVQHPDLFEEVLIKKHTSFIKDPYTRGLKDALGNGLLVSEGQSWKRQRQLMQPAFHRERISAYAEIMVAETERLLDTFRDGEERNLHADMTRLTAEIVAATLFGARLGGDVAKLSTAIDRVMLRFLGVFGTGMTLPAWLPTPDNVRFKQALKTIDALLARFIAERRRSPAGRTDLLSLLLDARDEDGSALDEKQLRDECVTLFVAGHETTALTLTYALLLLARHPEVAERVRRELEPLPARLGAGDVPRMRFTEAVIKEGMRLYPPAWGIGREATEDVEIGGFRIPRGTELWMVEYVIHRDARFFPDPERFLPERWLEPRSDLPRFAYFPFGGGPRVCIGNAFASMEATLALGTIARRFRFEPVTDRWPRLLPTVTLRPKDPVLARVFVHDAHDQRLEVPSG